MPRLIEKDYFCTLLLDHLSREGGAELVFKGGTSLTKIHSELYRLSEDLDYTIAVAEDASRSERSRRVEPVKTALSRLNETVPMFRVIDVLRGANNSTQYLAVVGYGSMLNQREETIKIEVSLREPLLTPVLDGAARTMLRSPFTNNPMVAPITVRCIGKAEALAEKFPRHCRAVSRLSAISSTSTMRSERADCARRMLTLSIKWAKNWRSQATTQSMSAPGA